MKQFRQGDIFFQEVSKLPKNLLKKKDPIIAHGEVTGHSHRVSEDVNFDNVDMYVDTDGTIYLQSKQETSIVHDEHYPIKLEPNKIYQIYRQREFDPVEEENRIVRD